MKGSNQPAHPADQQGAFSRMAHSYDFAHTNTYKRYEEADKAQGTLVPAMRSSTARLPSGTWIYIPAQLWVLDVYVKPTQQRLRLSIPSENVHLGDIAWDFLPPGEEHIACLISHDAHGDRERPIPLDVTVSQLLMRPDNCRSVVFDYAGRKK
jgi:hypothetical protein